MSSYAIWFKTVYQNWLQVLIELAISMQEFAPSSLFAARFQYSYKKES